MITGGVVVAIEGEDKTGKSTLGLSFLSDGPLYHMDLDMGGFRRARYRFNEYTAAGKLVSQPYPIPQQMIRERLLKEGVAAGQSTAKAPARLVGVKELWYKFLTDYLGVLDGSIKAPCGEEFQTVQMDSFAQVWELCGMAYLQELQEDQIRLAPNKPPRKQLIQIEYKEPNQRMRSLIYAAREVGKNLVLTHNMSDLYENKLVEGEIKSVVTGRTSAGWKHIGKEADLILHCSLRVESQGKGVAPKIIPSVEVIMSGLTMDMVGISLDSPTWPQIESMVKLFRGEE